MIYVISDLHGYPLEDFEQLLSEAGFSDGDFCFILGDVIDRGEDGARLLEWLMYQPNIELILGNHEQMLLLCDFLFDEITEESLSSLSAEQVETLMHWRENGGEQTMSGLLALDNQTRLDILEYLREAPLYDEVEVGGVQYVLTHSGLGNFSPDKDIDEYKEEELLWSRPSFDDEYYKDKKVVFGHTPTHYYGHEYKGSVLIRDTWINIDTGASGGLAPTLLRLDDMKSYKLEDER